MTFLDGFPTPSERIQKEAKVPQNNKPSLMQSSLALHAGVYVGVWSALRITSHLQWLALPTVCARCEKRQEAWLSSRS